MSRTNATVANLTSHGNEPMVISYLRFSSRPQEMGQSQARQLGGADTPQQAQQITDGFNQSLASNQSGAKVGALTGGVRYHQL